MKAVKTISKILVALAAIAGVVYVVATYGDKIVTWAKGLLKKSAGGCSCGCDCDEDCDCGCQDGFECTCCCGDESEDECCCCESAEDAETVVAEEADFEG